MWHGAVFKSNRRQPVRLPQAAALPDDTKRADIVVLGRSRPIKPSGERWDTWFEQDVVSDDYMSDREQPAARR